MAFRKFIYSTTEAALNNAITAKTVTNDDIAFVNENGVMFIQTQGVKFPCGYSKAEADNRYLKLTGGTLTGHVYFDDASVVFIGDGTRSSLELESTSGMDITDNGYSITTDAGIDGGFSGYWNDGTASSNNNIPIASFNIDYNGYNIRGRDGSGSSAKNVARATHDSYGAIVGKTDDPSDITLEEYGFGFFADFPSSDSFVGLTPTGVKLYGGSSSKILVSDGTMSTLKTINNTSLLGSGNISVLTSHQDISGKSDKTHTHSVKINGVTKTIAATGGTAVDLGTYLTSHQDISGKQDKSTAVTHTANAAVGSATRPVYVNASGQATATTYQLNATVPSGAKFTDTTYSAATTSTAGLMSAADKVKLNGIATGAQVNTVTGVKGNAESSYRTGNINITPANIGAIASSEKGAKSGVVPLNASGVIDSTYLPSYVDDVLEYSSKSSFPETGETGKIYVDTSAEENNTYRWSGSQYILIAKNTNTTYKLTKSGSTITLTGSDGATTSVTDSNTTYSTGTASYSGTTKLYTGTGTATDGTMTQSAINTALSGKANSSHTHTKSQITDFPTSLKNPSALSWSGYSSGSYDGSAAKSITIPNNTNQLTNGAGYITSSGSITGNAATATKIGTATVGSSTKPVYINAGTPTAISYALGNACSKTTRTKTSVGDSGWSSVSTDSQYVPDMAFIAYWNGAYDGTASNLAYCNKGAFGSFATKSSLAFSELTGKPTTISGYGITDAKISSGTITLGSNSITPLTSHQSLANCVQTVTTSGSGNAVTAISKSGSTLTATKGTTFVKSAGISGTGNAVTGYSLSSGTLTLTKGNTFVPYSDVVAGSTVDCGTFSKIPKIGSDGCMEVGRYMDFHHSNTTKIDFNVRLQTQNDTTSANLLLPTKSGTLALTSQIESQSNVDGIEFNNNAAIWASSGKTDADITINNNCIVDQDGWIYTPYIELGDSSNNGSLAVYYNGRLCSLNMQKALQVGLFS